MAREGEYEFEWDVWAYNDAIKKSAALEECTALLRRMEVAEVTPNAVTFHGILECALRGAPADAKAACDIFERIPRAQRNHHTYACAIRLYAMLDCGAQTARLLAEGKEHNIAPDADMIAASMEAQMAASSRRADVEDGDAAGSGAGGSRRGAGGAGGRRMSKAERRKAKRRSERACDSDDDDDTHGRVGGGDAVGEGAGGGGAGGGGLNSKPQGAGESSAPAPAGLGTSNGAAGTGVGAEGGREKTDVVLPTETALPDLCASGNGGEDVEFDDEVAGPAPLREVDIDWGSGPQRGAGGAAAKPTMVFEIPKGQVSAGRLDQYLSEHIPFLSRTAITKMIKEGYVMLSSTGGGGGDRVAKPAAKTKAGDVINVYLPAPATCADILPDPIPLQLLYEDASLVVLNKQAGLTVHPCAGVPRGTMVNALAHHFTTPGFNAVPQGGAGGGGGLSSVGAGGARPGIVHRLDRFTSGCIIVAKSDLAHWRLADDFAQHQVDKRYLAIVHGQVAQDQTTINEPIGRHSLQRELMCVKPHGDKTGKTAKTICRVRERYGQFTLVELQLLTGRTHQIRVHLSHLGHPIAGDCAYGGKSVSQRDLILAKEAVGVGDHRAYVGGVHAEGTQVLSRQALHATKISFSHPMEKRQMNIIAPLYKDMRTAIALLRQSARFQSVAVAGATVDLTAIGLPA
eukprot:Tamp_06597.p1 GENE.Tamp_06597~~Tamp_06597.p1  ORF type:complete len:779 (-),score=143.10 Tamp_06597:338-2392(-)